MNLTKRFLILSALLLATLLAITGHLVTGILFVVAVEFAIARPQPMCGVNALGTLAATQILVMEALALIYTKRPILRNISTGFTDRDTGVPFAVFGQQVLTRTLGVPTVGAFGAAANARADVDVPVTLNQHQQVLYSFTAAEYSSTNRDLIRESVEPLTVSIGNAMVDAVAAIWTFANFPNRTGADAVANNTTATRTVVGAGWDYQHLVNVGAALDGSGVPDYKRFYAAGIGPWASFQTDPRIVGYFWNQNNGSAIRDGYLPNVNGMDLAKYPGITAAAGGNLVGFAGSPDSTVYAARAMKDPREMPGFADVPFPGLMTTVTENMINTGLTLNMELWIAPTDLSANFRLHWMYGTAVGNKNNGQLITSQ